MFDERVTVDHDLNPGEFDQCHACRRPISDEDKRSEQFQLGVSCPKCYDESSPEQKQRFAERQKQIELARARGRQHRVPRTKRHHLKMHKLTHSGKKPFVCDQCEYSSTQAQALKRHKLKHSGDRPHACNQCNYSSTTAQALKTHKMIHNGENLFTCDHCEYSSRQASNLKTHKL